MAVLGFEDLTPGEDQAWLADGMAEAIRGQLERIDGLRVIGPYSSLSIRGLPREGTPIGDALGTRYLLGGSVRKSADSIWVTPGLIDMTTGLRVWGATYGRTFAPSDLREIHNGVARAVARAFELRFTPSPQAKGTVPSGAAYDAFLEGRYHLRRFQAGVTNKRDELGRSVAYLRRVVAQSPSWAPGLTALGEALHWVGMYESEQGESDVSFAESKEMLARALEIDPTDARAHASLGYVLHRSDLDFTGAQAHFQRALQLDPDQYWHCGYALFLLWAGRYEEAVQAFRRAEAQDPLYVMIKAFLASSYLCTGRYEEAIATSETVLTSIPGSASARRDLVLALERSGRVDQAFVRIDEAVTPDHPYWDLLRALLHARAGRREPAEAVLLGLDESALTDAIRTVYPSRRVSPAPLHAAVLVALGRPDDAIQALRSALDRDPDVLLYDRCYPELDSLQEDPHYAELLRRSGVPGW